VSSRAFISAGGRFGTPRDSQWIVPATLLVFCQYVAALVIGYSVGFVPTLPTFKYMAIALVISLVGGSIIALSRIRQYWREREQNPIARLVREADRTALATYFFGFQLVSWQMGSLTWLKDMLPTVIPYWADPALASLDRAILGTDAWRLIPGWLTRPLDIVYVTWALAETFALYLILCWKPSQLKTRALLAYFLIVGVMGVGGQYVLSSAGPVFYDRIVGGGQFAALASRNDVHAPFVGLAMNLLWTSYSTHSDQIGGGISAMPSMHVATTTWIALMLPSVWPRMRIPCWGYWFVIFVGSFGLGWHYFLDAVVGTLGAVGCWKLAGQLLSRDRHAIRADRLAPAA
jgi:hypothetical protein